ncbi:helix-turn-helix domain-containing protein [Rhizobium cremeum]|uniref:helix-turn-helix domain-containing protein n=1 Tax=Rhizobium cremeum TaxID=2813827 RepID=UPI001FD364D2|nr:helix-turn-helix domain-containing protein [Rhizobium cremeum]MCJ7996082.1 helix-turn-helix domain-containing protein [Rhizobium cremeum]MCJ8001341.1 helix-turn-helix domain-containing protein [Rhizobium cremeum]
MSERPPVPAAIEEIAETIGVRLALRIVQTYGGLEIKFPKHPHDDHPVILALGKEDGYAICKYMGGSFLSVPHCRPPRNARAAIARLEAEGLSRGEIARRLGLTQRHVRRMANAPPTSQLSLFPDE